ncbi:hypothetical protein DBR06_SOUSAS5410003, partial [Sousa chinensis]
FDGQPVDEKDTHGPLETEETDATDGFQQQQKGGVY